MKSVNGCCEREERWEGRAAGEDKGRPESSLAARILMAGGRVTWAGLWLCRLQRSGGQSSLDASRPQLGRLASVAAVWWGRAIHCRVFRAQGSGSRASLPYKLKIRDAVEVSRGGVNVLHSPRTTPLRYGLFSGPFSGPKSCEGGMSFRQFHVPHDLHRVHLPSLVRTNYNHLCTHPFATLDFLHSSAGQGDNGGAAQQMRTANADAWTMSMAQGPKVPSAASSASSAHRPPPTARTSVEHGADGKAQNNSQRPRVQVGACLKLSWRVAPPGNINHPPPAWPGQNQTRVAVVWLAVTALFMFKGSCPGVRKRAAPGVIQRHACGQASPTSRVPKSPCWRWLHGAGIFGESRENPKASWKHHELPNMSILDPKSGKSC